MDPLTERIIFAVAGLVLIPLIVADMRWRSRMAKQANDHEAFIGFLKAYLLKNAVLEFHSPDPKHKAADRAIERLVEGKELQPEEIKTLVHRIETEAVAAEDTKRRLQAQTALVLMDEFMEAVTGHKYTAFADYE
jgi:hypothetical protein